VLCAALDIIVLRTAEAFYFIFFIHEDACLTFASIRLDLLRQVLWIHFYPEYPHSSFFLFAFISRPALAETTLILCHQYLFCL